MKPYAILPLLLQILAWPVAHFIFRINGTFVVYGREYLKDLKNPVVFASNHVNDLDPVVQRAIHPFLSKPLFWVARYQKYYRNLPEEQKWRGWQASLYTDWFFRSWGAHPAHAGVQDYAKSLEHIIKLMNDGYSVSIFPCGGKEKHLGKQAPVRGGVAFLASHLGIPIIPIAIKGTKGINAKKLFLQKTAIEVHILPPVILPKEGVDYQREAKRIMNSIYDVLP